MHFNFCLRVTAAGFPQHSNQQHLDFPCAVLSLLALWCTGEGVVHFKRKRGRDGEGDGGGKKGPILLLWLAEDPGALPNGSKADGIHQKSYTQGAVIVQTHVLVQY